MASDNDKDDLERALQDERRHRVIAQHRLAERSEQVEAWRKRSDDRAERIDRLTARRDGLLEDRVQMIIRRDILLEKIVQLIARRDKLIGERDQLIGERDQLRRERDAFRAERDEVLTIFGWPKVVLRRVIKWWSSKRNVDEPDPPTSMVDGLDVPYREADSEDASNTSEPEEDAVSPDTSLEVVGPTGGESADSTSETLVDEVEDVLAPTEVAYGSASRKLVGSPRFPSFSVLPLGVSDPSVLLVLGQFRILDLHDDPTQIYRADFVVVGEDGMAGLTTEARDLFERWEQEIARQPLLWMSASIPGGDFGTTGRTIRVGRDGSCKSAPDDVDFVMRTVFDPAVWSPAARVSFGTMMTMEGADQSRIHDDDGELWVAGDPDLSIPWMLSAAAAGIPFCDERPDSANVAVAKTTAARRRVVFAQHSPWVVASQLLDRMSLVHRGALPPLTGVLISNRPHLVVSAIERFSQQSYGELSLVVGCHEFSSDVVANAVAELPDRIPVTVLEFDSRRTLGQCLNESIASATGTVIAKIDDDDHYGPGYLEDSVQAMLYSGSPLVGKLDCFVYLESEDATYRRRPTESEIYVEGFLMGPSLVFRRSLWEAVSFPDRSVGEDTAFQSGAAALGVEPYAASRWEFVYRRFVRGNTWSSDDKGFTVGSTVAWVGDEPYHSDLNPA